MARKKAKSSTLKANLRFEVYGILIITLSVISLAGKGEIPGVGSVGHAFSYIYFFILGKFYMILPLIFIYIGLYAMVKRKWPASWSIRKTGLVLLLFAMLINSHTNMFQDLQQSDAHTTTLGIVLKQPFENINDLLSGEKTANQYKEGLGGGMLGAIVYAFLYVLFDNLGARIIEILLFAIAFLCITGLSYVDMGRKIKSIFGATGSQFKFRFKEMFMLLTNRGSTQGKPKLKLKTTSEGDLPFEEEIHEENYRPEASSRKKPAFFQLFQKDQLNEAVKSSNGDNDNIDDEEVVYRAFDTAADTQHDQGEYQDQAAAIELVSPIPLIRDFQDTVNNEIQTSDSTRAVSISAAENSDNQGELGTIEFDTNDKPAVEEIPYQLPPFNLLSKPAGFGKNGGQLDYKATARKLETTLESFGVKTKVLEVVRGPSVTRYEIQPDVGVKVSKIVGLTDDIALALAAKDIRMEAPIPGKAAIGIEVPNSEVSVVTMREVMESSAFHESESKLSITLGRDISGQAIVANLAKMPHLLVAGATGSGKSVCINGIITSILYKAKPDEVKFLMIDPKMVELNVYNGIPHLLAPVVTDPRRASLALKKVVVEMEKRYELFSKSGTRNIEGYNNLMRTKPETEANVLPFIVVIVDELADLMMVAANDVEDAICRLAQMARAAGIHLIIATQRPSVDVITGLIKANIPSRIAFGVSSQVDSRTILDAVGAEKLLGRGDMLFLPVGASKSLRVQGAFLSDQEVEAVVSYCSNQGKAEFQEELVPEVDDQAVMVEEVEDELFDQAVQIILDAKQASVSLLQRRMRVGYTRAARLIDSMEAKGLIGPYEGSKPREVLVSMEQYVQDRKSS
jgi:S-DNA-T family DNA segregation ATPase FtsK/SpoIIIE